MPWRLIGLVFLAFPLTGCRVDTKVSPTRADPSVLAAGEKLFTAYCSPCHNPDGRGVERAGPPLAGSPWVSGSEERLARILLHGAGGPIEVVGKTYELEMPGFGPVLRDTEIAALLSWVRARFGSPSAPVAAETVGRIRAATLGREGYWTAAELLDLP